MAIQKHYAAFKGMVCVHSITVFPEFSVNRGSGYAYMHVRYSSDVT